MMSGGLIALKSLGRWTPCRTLLKRGFAQERPTSNNEEKVKGSAAAEASTSGSQQQAHEVKTTQQEINTDSDSGEIPTPSLLKATSTKDYLISFREEQLREKERSKYEDVDVMKLEETFKKGASTADLDSG